MFTLRAPHAFIEALEGLSESRRAKKTHAAGKHALMNSHKIGSFSCKGAPGSAEKVGCRPRKRFASPALSRHER
jgi:hypothetical protein